MEFECAFELFFQLQVQHPWKACGVDFGLRILLQESALRISTSRGRDPKATSRGGDSNREDLHGADGPREGRAADGGEGREGADPRPRNCQHRTA